MGVEAGLVDAPSIDLDHYLKLESGELRSALVAIAEEEWAGGAAEVDALLYPLQVQVHEEADANGVGGGPSHAQQVQASSVLAGRLFPNSLYIPGCKHSVDNALHDIWDAMSGKDAVMAQLKAFDSLIRTPAYRDKLVYLFFDQDPWMPNRLKCWKSGLKSLRWHEVVNFVKELLAVQHGFKDKWNLQKFVSALPKERHGELAEGRGPAGAATYKTVDAAMHSSYFWAYCDMILEVGEAPETLSRWIETCWYHGDKCTERSCCYKGCKAPELAAGIHKYLLKTMQSRANVRMSYLAPRVFWILPMFF